MIVTFLTLAISLAVLAAGGEVLVRGTVGIARHFKVPTLLTGLVLVGSATSMPEMVASVDAALQGSPGIAWGNIVGSNIANALLILGLVAIIAPIGLSGTGRRDAMVGLGAAVILSALAVTGLAARWVGVILLGLMFAYVAWRYSHPKTPETDGDSGQAAPAIALSAAYFLGGIGALVVSGHFLVGAAIDLARIAGLSETAIGLTVVAVGTSLPELAASVSAARRGQPGIAIGNVLGSNIFNILLIGGTTMTIAPLALPAELYPVELGVFLASAAILVVLLWRFHRIGRLLGMILVAGFVANTALQLA